MNLIVDTSVWSLVLRRPRVDEDNPFVEAFRFHIQQDDGVCLIGNILQELLDGVKSQHDFKYLIKLLEPFSLIELTRDIYIEAAQLRNLCRTNGIQAGPIDFLIAATCIHHGFPLLTADKDFSYISEYSDLIVFPAV